MSVLEVPAPEFAIGAIEPDPHAATPELRFQVDVSDASDRDVYTIALTAQVQIDADRRAYDPDTRERLQDLFGESERIPQTAGALQVGRVATLVPRFRGATTFTLAVPFSGDVELAATRYLSALSSGTVPLSFHFNGSIFYCDDAERLQVTLVPWSCEARCRARLADWRALVDRRYGGGGFARVSADTLEALRRRRIDLSLATFDETIRALLR